MKSAVYQSLFFILIYIKFTYQYPTGAPASTCGSMMPSHGVNSQACSSNYNVQADKTQYYTNETVRITVSGANGNTFRGILMIAKTASSSQIIGTWTVSDSNLQTLACSNVQNTGVTHTSNNDKSSVTAIWTPPSTVSTENTVVRVTIVKTYSTIYVDCFSVALTNKQNVQSSSVATTTVVGGTTASAASTIVPSTTTAVPTTTTTAVPTNVVTLNTNWVYTNGVTNVTMKVTNLRTSQWLALGLSLDKSMGNDHVFICQRLSNDTVTVARVINPGGHTFPVATSTVSNPGGTFTVISARLVDGVAYCQFTLSNFASSGRRRRDTITALSQSTSYYPLIAVGNLDSSNGLIPHTSQAPLDDKVQLDQTQTINYGINSEGGVDGLIKAHAIIMIFTWILLASTGILSARHFKPVWPEQKLCGKAIWFVIHRPVMASVVALTLLAFGLILIYEKGTWIPKTESKEFAHSIIGIIVISLAFIQPFMAIFRCKPDAEYRFIFNYIHRFVGLTALLLSTITIFIAVFFSEFNSQQNSAWGILVAWVLWIFFVFIAFWLIDFFFEKNAPTGKSGESYDLSNPSASENNLVNSPNKIMQDRIKQGLLAVHILVAFGLALGLSIVIGSS